MVLLVAGGLLWLFAGFVGHLIAKDRWVSRFGDTEGLPSWAFLTILGPMGLIAGFLYSMSVSGETRP